MMGASIVVWASLLLGTGGAPPAPVKVVTTLPVYADLVRAIGGSEVDVTSIATASDDAHFVRPKPSFALALKNADLFVTTGLDLELWAPTLLDRAGNPRVSEGGVGYVTAYTGIKLLEVPVAADRSAGDVHIYGNPHLTSDPLRTLQVAENIATGLKRVAPDRAALFDRNLASFRDQLDRKLFGDALVEALGAETLEQLARSGGLMDFLASNQLAGHPLSESLGGWLKTAEAFRGKGLICYHKNWAYFEERFGVTCVDYVEAKPGIPPTPGHVAELIDLMKTRGIRVLLAASYFDRGKVTSVADRGGAEAVMVPLYSDGTRGAAGYFSMVDDWVTRLAAAFQHSAASE
ncbi:MAG: metal ABC transporter substrate-binding protein [Gemmatimonadota bacterium]